jgi:phosphopantetheine--protein transferase-like protein
MTDQDKVRSVVAESGNEGISIGIDIENYDSIPAATDPWAEPFFTDHFSQAEIAHCQRQANARESFCGVWCAKEAVMKSCAAFSRLTPKEIEIQWDVQGRPLVAVLSGGKLELRRDCVVSISHSHGLAAAVCLAGVGRASAAELLPDRFVRREASYSRSGVLPWVAMGLGLLNLLLWLLFFVRK